MTTAMPSTVALKSSWPTPLAIDAMLSVPSATIPAPARPATIPAASQRARPGTVRVAAATIPISSAASRTSRKTMTAVASMANRRCLLGDDRALGGLFVVFADVLVASRLEGADEDRRRGFARDHLFAIERMAVEFFRCRIAVLDDELDLLAGRDHELGGLEFVVLDHKLEFVVGGARRRGQQKAEEGGREQAGKHGHPGQVAVDEYE